MSREDRSVRAGRRAGWAAACVVATLGACGGQASSPSDAPRLTIDSRCADWKAAAPAARSALASRLEHEGETTAARSRRIERACRRYGDDVSIEDALARFAVDQHRPAG